jgi:hypothetical protein
VAVTPGDCEDETKPRPTDRPGLQCCSGEGAVFAIDRPRTSRMTTRVGLSRYDNGIVLNTPHGVTAPAPLMLCVPVMPGM